MPAMLLYKPPQQSLSHVRFGGRSSEYIVIFQEGDTVVCVARNMQTVLPILCYVMSLLRFAFFKVHPNILGS